ncbi:hypothetical protein SISSUDRAFT_1120653 [Sistotremastrum suecicum HHB10207 ss-3]|uniref:Uncharacterized protein n=1 Tax=Sistotremastrum suecicum HHB10207 ss-3 TaxID=1314776 RepID=A0A166BZU9_9AGAM|nr:hypothetical protein SISSUDRAFT_1120653 [Sistotremastrum suecicum HHB10207 ss-3]
MSHIEPVANFVLTNHSKSRKLVIPSDHSHFPWVGLGYGVAWVPGLALIPLLVDEKDITSIFSSRYSLTASTALSHYVRYATVRHYDALGLWTLSRESVSEVMNSSWRRRRRHLTCSISSSLGSQLQFFDLTALLGDP